MTRACQRLTPPAGRPPDKIDWLEKFFIIGESMATWLPKPPLINARINDRFITVKPRETLLQAALRSGIDFPNSCRVGACGTCKCRLVEGKAKELTETGYLLTAEEIDRGYILACQSVPLSNLSIAVDLAQQPRRRSVTGRVIAQEKVTPDITRLTVQLDGAMSYTAGQFAYVRIEGLDGVVRSYSFATPARDDSRVSFFVRKVSGGRFSTLVNEQDVMGRSVQVEGPAGDFWLRPGAEPLLFVAGGSGLAPILAILEEAIASRVSRSATLLFGAREERDLYALDAIQSIAQRWHGKFQFVPVLSAAGEDSTWTGKRGLVTESIPELLEQDSHVYLCGPPLMIDGARALLAERSVPSEHLHFDRFTTQADALVAADASETALLAATPSTAPLAGVLHYLKYFLLHGVGLLSIAAILAGGHYVTVGLVLVLALYIIGDVCLGDDTSTPNFKYPQILTAQLWLALPLLALIVFTGVWSVCSSDPLGFGAWLTQWIGYDVVAARDTTG